MEVYLNILANIIINVYLNRETTNCLYIINDDTSTFVYKGNIPVILLNPDLLRKNPNAYTKFGCENFIMNVKTTKKTFVDVELAIKYGDKRFNTRKYLILPTSLEKNTTEVFLTKAIDYVSDVVAIFPGDTNITEDVTFKLYTHNYVGLRNYNDVYMLDEWFSKNSSFLYGNNLYPDKLSNQHGRTFRLGTNSYKPYSIIDDLDGTEIIMALEIANKYNMTFIIKDFEQVWGEARENFTGVGLLGGVAMDECDISFAAMLPWFEDYPYLDLCVQIFQTHTTALVPGPILQGGWLTPFMPFTMSMWIACLVSLTFCFFAILIVISFSYPGIIPDMRENVIISMMETEALYLGQSTSVIPNKLSSRLIYAFVMILGLITATTYSGGLASTMTTPRYTRILRTIKDLADADIKWGGHTTAWLISIENSENPVHQKLITTFVETGKENLTRLNEEEFGYAMERLQDGNFALGDYITPEGANKRRILEEDLYYDYTVSYVRKGSILLPIIDNLLLKMAQAGLDQYWEYDVVSNHLNSRTQMIVKFSTQTPKAQITPLRFAHVEGAFALWTVGLVLATICFIYEKLSQ